MEKTNLDLTGWTEYISDDPGCAKPPYNVPLALMQVVTCNSSLLKEEYGPAYFKATDPKERPICKLYWKVKSDKINN